MRKLARLGSVAMSMVLAMALWLAPAPPTQAAINAQNLGAKYDGDAEQHHVPRLLLARHAHRGVDLQDARPARRRWCATC